MSPTQTRATLEERFNQLDDSLEEELGTVLAAFSGMEGRDLFYAETDKTTALLSQARGALDGLLNFLQTKNVVVVKNEDIGPRNLSQIERLASQIYISAKLALGIREDADELLREVATRGDGNRKTSLGQHVKANFILAELYTALGIRKKQAIAAYDSVIEEGKTLFRRLQETAVQNGKRPQFYINMVLIAHDIAASYKRRYDLDEGRNAARYGYDPVSGERVHINPQYKEARKWYHTMLDLIKSHSLQDISSIFGTQYEFERYLEDIRELRVPCIYADADRKALEDETGTLVPRLECKVPERFSGCAYKKDGNCTLFGDDIKAIRDAATRIAFMREHPA